MDNSLLKKKIDENLRLLNERLEDAMSRTAIMKALDLVALEALRLDIPNWETMRLGKLRAEIKNRQDIERLQKQNESAKGKP